MYKTIFFFVLVFHVCSQVSNTIEYFGDLYNPLDNLEPFLHHLTQLREDNLLCCSVAKSCLPLWNPKTTPQQTSLFFTVSWSLLEFVSIESVRCYLTILLPLFLLLPSVFFPTSGVFPMSMFLVLSWQSFAYLVDYFRRSGYCTRHFLVICS